MRLLYRFDNKVCSDPAHLYHQYLKSGAKNKVADAEGEVGKGIQESLNWDCRKKVLCRICGLLLPEKCSIFL